ncbi:DUF397 domain-containing protein [Plantactinospora sp. B24E8]|uniref:DUF397 domain-containing protein n=1 Tax=Plantactinospora sp. B24E8 TaxID=3153567 RepID=UPI00325DA341
MVRSDGSWRTSSRSGSEGNCVEVAWSPGAVRVRDSKDRPGPVLTFAEPAWQAFVRTTRPES